MTSNKEALRIVCQSRELENYPKRVLGCPEFALHKLGETHNVVDLRQEDFDILLQKYTQECYIVKSLIKHSGRKTSPEQLENIHEIMIETEDNLHTLALISTGMPRYYAIERETYLVLYNMFLEDIQALYSQHFKSKVVNEHEPIQDHALWVKGVDRPTHLLYNKDRCIVVYLENIEFYRCIYQLIDEENLVSIGHISSGIYGKEHYIPNSIESIALRCQDTFYFVDLKVVNNKKMIVYRLKQDDYIKLFATIANHTNKCFETPVIDSKLTGRNLLTDKA